MKEIIWTDLVRNAEVLQKEKGDRSVLKKKRELTLLVKSCVGTAF